MSWNNPPNHNQLNKKGNSMSSFEEELDKIFKLRGVKGYAVAKYDILAAHERALVGARIDEAQKIYTIVGGLHNELTAQFNRGGSDGTNEL